MFLHFYKVLFFSITFLVVSGSKLTLKGKYSLYFSTISSIIISVSSIYFSRLAFIKRGKLLSKHSIIILYIVFFIFSNLLLIKSLYNFFFFLNICLLIFVQTFLLSFHSFLIVFYVWTFYLI